MPLFRAEDFLPLLRAAQGGLTDAIGQLLEPFREALQASAQRQLSPKLARHCSAAEVVQETFQSAVANIAAFRGDAELQFNTWLHRILQRRIQKLGLRHLGTQKRGDGDPLSLEYHNNGVPLRELLVDSEPTPSTSMSLRERDTIMRETLATLAPDYRELIRLRVESRKTVAEMAALLGKSPDAVSKSWPRALRAWRKALAARGVTDW